MRLKLSEDQVTRLFDLLMMADSPMRQKTYDEVVRYLRSAYRIDNQGNVMAIDIPGDLVLDLHAELMIGSSGPLESADFEIVNTLFESLYEPAHAVA